MNNQEISIRYENPCADLCKIIILESSSSEEIENALKSIHQLLKDENSVKVRGCCETLNLFPFIWWKLLNNVTFGSNDELNMDALVLLNDFIGATEDVSNNLADQVTTRLLSKIVDKTRSSILWNVLDILRKLSQTSPVRRMAILRKGFVGKMIQLTKIPQKVVRLITRILRDMATAANYFNDGTMDAEKHDMAALLVILLNYNEPAHTEDSMLSVMKSIGMFFKADVPGSTVFRNNILFCAVAGQIQINHQFATIPRKALETLSSFPLPFNEINIMLSTLTWCLTSNALCGAAMSVLYLNSFRTVNLPAHHPTQFILSLVAHDIYPAIVQLSSESHRLEIRRKADLILLCCVEQLSIERFQCLMSGGFMGHITIYLCDSTNPTIRKIAVKALGGALARCTSRIDHTRDLSFIRPEHWQTVTQLSKPGDNEIREYAVFALKQRKRIFFK